MWAIAQSRTTEDATMANNPTSLRNEDTKPRTGPTPTAIPEVEKPAAANNLTKRGVREECLVEKQREFPEETDKQWFVLRVTYNRAEKAKNFFRRHKIKHYLPMQTIRGRDVEGRRKRTRPLLPNLIFVYDTADRVRQLVKDTPQLPFLRYYYNKLALNPDGTQQKLTLSYTEMLNFIVVTSVKNPFVRLVPSAKCHFKSGDLVRVTRGDFKDVVGRIARVGNQTCVIVELRGVCLVATAYVPKEDLEEVKYGMNQ